MGPGQAIRTCMSRSTEFAGRAGRPEFWWFASAWTIAMALLLWVAVNVIGLDAVLTFAPFIVLAASIPLHSASVRRVYDTGFSRAVIVVFLPVTVVVGITLFGRYLILSDAPDGYAVAGWLHILISAPLMMIALLVAAVLLALPSQPGPNKYGPNPNEVIQ